MEQSLGKRIAQYRKALGLTQDALAEKLGITAQAVSKWENDLSCPDIALLPRLAEIFGISTDTLLGRDASQVVHNAEVVDREETADSSSSGSKWEFHWDGGRIHALRFAVFVLLVGGLVLADRLLGWQIRFWDICWPSFVLVYSLFGLMRKFSFLYLGGTLLGGYYLALNLSLFPTPIDRNLLLPILLLLLGLSLLADVLRKPKKPSFRIVSNGDPKKSRVHCQDEGDRFFCEVSFDESTHLVDLERLSGGEAQVSFGELTVDLTGCDTVTPDCRISANCSFGHILLLVPKYFRIVPASSSAFGSVNMVGQPDGDASDLIALEANASFGDITVRYV